LVFESERKKNPHKMFPLVQKVLSIANPQQHKDLKQLQLTLINGPEIGKYQPSIIWKVGVTGLP